MSGDLKAMLEALLAQLARLRAERERLEALIRAYEEAEMARLRQMIAELLAQLNKLKVGNVKNVWPAHGSAADMQFVFLP